MCYVFISRRTVCVLIICKHWFRVNEVEAWLAQMHSIFSCVCVCECLYSVSVKVQSVMAWIGQSEIFLTLNSKRHHNWYSVWLLKTQPSIKVLNMLEVYVRLELYNDQNTGVNQLKMHGAIQKFWQNFPDW